MIVGAKDDSLELWEVEKLVPYDKNPKVHSAEHVNALAKTISEVGFTVPIVVDKDGIIIAGHRRRLAALRLGMKFVPVRVMHSMTSEQAKAARLADNRVVHSEYDEELEQAELAELAMTEIDLSALGYDERELEFLTADLGEMDTSSLLADLDIEVKAATEKTEARAKAVEAEAVSVGEAMGFKTVTVEQARRIGAFLGQAENVTGEKGAAALDAFLVSLGI